MRYLREIAHALTSEAWAVDLRHLNALTAFVRRHLAAGTEPDEAGVATLRAAMGIQPPAGPRQANGVGVIPIYGFLVNHASPLAEMFGMATGYDRIAADFDAMMASSDVGSIILDIDSGGGSVYGMNELSARIFAARGQKRVVAIANSFMCSAAYEVGSAADEIVATPSSETGSIGIYMVHEDWTAADEQAGIKRTVFSAGKFKSEAVPGMPLTEEAAAALQARVDEVYDGMAKDIARNRGVSPAAVKSGFGEGRSLGAKMAKEAGLIDRIGTMDDVLGKLLPKAPRASGKRADFLNRKLALDTLRVI